MINSLIQGFVIGFSFNAPIGPIGVFCIRRTLADGLLAGLWAGFGAATADGILGTISAVGVHQISVWLSFARFWLSIGGGVLLLGFAVWIVLRPSVGLPMQNHLEHAKSRRSVGIKSFFLTLGFTIINPLSILLFVAIFAGIDPAAPLTSLLNIVLGMFISALICWTVLALLTHYVRLRLGSRMMTAVNWLSAAAFVGFGVWAILSGFHPV